MADVIEISLGYSTSDDWAAIPVGGSGCAGSAGGHLWREGVGPRAGLSLARAGDMGLSAPGAAARRGNFLRSLGRMEANAYGLHQVHSRSVLTVDGIGSEECAAKKADGMVCATAGKILTVTVADCLPVFMADRMSGAFALVHSGWKGTGIVSAAVRLMRTEYGSKAEDLAATIGPGIGACCYRVPRERWEAFRNEFGPAAVAGGQDEDCRLDLRRANVDLLRGEGIRDIAVVTDCTACSPGLGSFRRQGPQGFTRMLAFIGRAEGGVL